MNQEPNQYQGQVPAANPCNTSQQPPATQPPCGQQPAPTPCDPTPAPTPCDPAPAPMPAPTPCEPKPTTPTSTGVPKLPDPPQRCTDCCCPEKPPASPDCFDRLIEEQTKILTAADKAKNFANELAERQKGAINAQQKYTVDMYNQFLDSWTHNDVLIVKACNTLACQLSCWHCLIECRLCPLLYDIRDLEDKLDGTGKLPGEVFSLRDLGNWRARDLYMKSQRFTRIEAIIVAWEKLIEKISGALTEINKWLTEFDNGSKNSNVAKNLYELLGSIVPLHMMIGPREADGSVHTQIDRKFIDICNGDARSPDQACGPDMGRLPVRLELIGMPPGPYPYLVHPDRLLEILCCLVTGYYKPAKQAQVEAEADLAAITAQITKAQTDITKRKASLAADFLFGLEIPVDCNQYRDKPTTPPPPSTGDCQKPAPTDPPCDCAKHGTNDPAPPR
ncbi:hypothetical protein BTHE68_72200 (plasmid) [Burkholderia sp. THE68]|uniref:hypothetical protein n=1 Tax=Burkholderia sp. THE68 TaxID=758782 RepID=UPI0013185124|nr:hypothetical protein [Burkholderia sp. THE68]BBU33486.1 hypothetical protein BTHE68_72200 [Burkholderia sp. THE68]